MKVFRFMSKVELEKFQKGYTLVNNKKHRAKTTSKGFCFLSLDDFEPEYAIHFLSGIVNLDVCAIFEVNQEELKEAQGTYHKVISHSKWSKMTLRQKYESHRDTFDTKEYCTSTYNNRNFKLLKYTKDTFKYLLESDPEWKWIYENIESCKNED